MYLGIDDTDSPDGMCTTYLGALIAEDLKQHGCTIQKMRLIRLNPNVPWKTRGNAGICIEFDGDAEYALQTAGEFIDKYAQFSCDNTNPGLVLCKEKPPKEFYFRALQGFCTVEEAIAELEEIGAKYVGYKNKRGLIGALAAISAVLPDWTYEYLAYRKPEVFGTERIFDAESVKQAEMNTTPHTWDSWDFTAEKAVCFPHGKDPVLYGIRGDSPEWVMKAVSYLKTEEVSLSVLWETNQGTDAHILSFSGELLEGRSYSLRGVVSSMPETHEGGHVSFELGNLLCYAFEPTKIFRRYVRALIPGDEIIVYGGYQKGVLHLEKFQLVKAALLENRESPRCPVCGGRMTSAGKGKGYKCRSCSGRIREPVFVPRLLSEGWYEVPPDARRHLAKPVIRIVGH
ncbi:MAG TPA: tRNA(Ile)(2)-agmatinylcytidine synthase [Methanocorpusculum sp.]|nr:tRNA(Ile)(2)-agmatinylcytidine synthase [Methanocorpusculum sp.]